MTLKRERRGGNPCRSEFVADGAERHASAIRAAALPAIEAAVQAEYAERLAAAGRLRRWWLHRQIRAEIRQRLAREQAAHAPPDETLY